MDSDSNDDDDVLVSIRKRKLDRLIAERNSLRTKLAEKDAQIVSLNARIFELQQDINGLKAENRELRAQNREFQQDINNLKADNRELKADNHELKAQIARSKSLLQLKSCNDLASDAFQTEYRKRFNKSRRDWIPSLGSFMSDEPTDENTPEYVFWQDFIKSYPGTNNENIKEIFRQINKDRNEDNHPPVTYMSRAEFDKCMRDAFASKYSTEQNIQYREWSFLFPS